jgi:mRNA-degrading endonuclease RelE of RelBE toxin-antitoxin system
MKIVWSNGAKKALTKIDGRYHRRIEVKLAELDDRSAPDPISKNIGFRKSFRLRVGDYRIVITLRGDPNNDCYVLAVKRRTSTSYLHEENAPYGCSAN